MSAQDNLKKRWYNVLYFLYSWYRRLFRVKTYASRMIIRRGAYVLLVRRVYGNLWVLPGGRRSGGETFLETALRESREETGFEVTDIAGKLGHYKETTRGRRKTVEVFVAKKWTRHDAQYDREIGGIRWFKLSKLPKNASAGTRRRLEEYKQWKPRQEFTGKW